MRTKGSKNKQTDQKYKEFILSLHFYLKDGATSNFKMQDHIDKHKVSGRLITVMKRDGIIKNTGTPKQNLWIWNSIPPNSAMIKKIISETRYFQSIYTKRKKDKDNAPQFEFKEDKIVQKQPETITKIKFEVKFFFGLFKIYINQV